MTPYEYDELERTVERYATGESDLTGWTIKTAADVFDEPNRLNAHPFADKNGVGLRLSYTRGGVTVQANVSSHPKYAWRDLLPSLIWKRTVLGAQHNLLLQMAATPKFTYAVRHPVFVLTSDTNMTDGFVSRCTATTRLSVRDQLGASFTYDPSRSGLKDYTLIYARETCAAVFGGDIVARYNATRGGGVHLRIPMNQHSGIVILAEKQRFIAGAEARSPCGAQLLCNVNLVDSRAAVTLSRFFGPVWEVTLHVSASINKNNKGYPSAASPRFGVVFACR